MTFEPPLYMQNSGLFEYSARQDRFLIDTFFAEGLLDAANTGAVTQRAAAANLSVDVAPFDAIVDGDDVPRQGAYLFRLVEGENVPVAAPPGTGSRLDLLVVEVLDGEAINLNGRPEGVRLRAIAGTPVTSGSPVLPTLPPTALPLASWPVAAGQTAILTSSITNRRVQSAMRPSFDVNLQVIVDQRFTDLLNAANASLTTTANNAVSAMNATRDEAVRQFDARLAAAEAPGTRPLPRVDVRRIGGKVAQVIETRDDGTTNTSTLSYANGVVTKIVQNNPPKTITPLYVGGLFAGWTVS